MACIPLFLAPLSFLPTHISKHIGECYLAKSMSTPGQWHGSSCISEEAHSHIICLTVAAWVIDAVQRSYRRQFAPSSAKIRWPRLACSRSCCLKQRLSLPCLSCECGACMLSSVSPKDWPLYRVLLSTGDVVDRGQMAATEKWFMCAFLQAGCPPSYFLTPWLLQAWPPWVSSPNFGPGEGYDRLPRYYLALPRGRCVGQLA